MTTPTRFALVAAIAAVMACLGMTLISLANNVPLCGEELALVVPRSIVLWLALALFLRHLPLPVGFYIGMLSPFLGAMTLFHFFAFLAVILHLPICIGIGVTTGGLVSWVMRHGRPRCPWVRQPFQVRRLQ